MQDCESQESPSTSRAAGKSPTARVELDPDFYFESVFVVFQVETCIFRVPTHLFVKESPFFAGMFKLPQPTTNGDNVEGSSPNNPIIMPPHITHEDFRSLMKVLYPLSVSLKLSLSKAEWISVLKLSTMWYFTKLRQLAISEIERSSKLIPVEKITLGRKYSISSWVVAGFDSIVRRDKAISDEEAIEMDYPTTVKLFRIRELELNDMLSRNTEKVEEVFIEELAFIRSEEEGFKHIPFVEVPIPVADTKRLEEEKQQKISNPVSSCISPQPSHSFSSSLERSEGAQKPTNSKKRARR